MRRAFSIFILFLSTAMLLTAMNQSFINRIKQDRYFDHLNNGDGQRSWYQRIFIRSDHWGYGDLYGVSFLPEFKHKLEPFNKYPRNGNNPVTNRTLYIIGDSFIADKTLEGAFNGFDNVIFLDRRFAFGPKQVDSTQENYLLLEFAEHNISNYNLDKTDESRWKSQQIAAKKYYTGKSLPATPQFPPTSLPERLSKIIFNKDLSRNIELLLFDDRLFTPFKEAKADLNYKLFGRVAKEVAVSTKKDRLFLNVTVDTADRESAFRPKSDRQIEQLAAHLVSARHYYLSIGFKKVFLSVIPNPVSIYDAHRKPYNHLLERIEQKTNLPAFSIYRDYLASKENLFYRSDAHWNPLGFDVWVKKTNQFLQGQLSDSTRTDQE